jgi:iron(III) transport system permease protein
MNWRLLGNSLAVSALTTLLACGFGVCAAVCLSALAVRVRKVAFVASIVALMLPPFLATNCWIHLLGATGVWRGWLPLSIYSLPGVVWILALIYWPITLLVVLGAWQNLERAFFEADPALRGTSLIRWLLLPAARPALAQAALITFVLALNHFAVPAILQVKVFPAEIWLRLSTELKYGAAWAMSTPLIIVSAIALVLLRRRRNEVSWPAQQSLAPADTVRMQLGPVFWICAAATLLVIFFSTLPLLQIAFDTKTWRELPTVFSATSQTVWNSFLYAALAATACLALAAWSWRWCIGWCAWLLFLAPGVLIGTIMIFLFNRPLLDVIYHSIAVVIIAFVCRFAALNWQGARAAMQRVDRDVLDALRLETGSRWRIFWIGYWPQTAATFAAVWYVTYLLCLWEVETLIMIYPPGGETLALRVFNLLHYGHIAQVNALCLLLLALAVLPLGLWATWSGMKVVGGRPEFADNEA